MGSALVTVLAFISIIIAGFTASRSGRLGKNADSLISTIVFKLTLPATIIHAFGSTDVQMNMLLLVLAGFLCSAIPYAIAFALTRRMENADRTIYLFGAGGMNIGCFALPFVQALFPPSCAVAVCMFDAGNSIVVTGGSFALTKTIFDGPDEGGQAKAAVKRLFSSIPFDCYMALIALALLDIRIPQVVIDFTEPIANANPFLSLFMLGLMMSFQLDKGKVGQLGRVIALRSALSACLTVAIFALVPFDAVTRTAIVTVLWAPMSALTPVYTLWCGGDHGLAGLASAVTIVEGVLMMFLIMLAAGIV